MYTRTLDTPIGTETGGALTHVDIPGIIRWDPVNKILKISVSYGTDNNGFVPSSRLQDNYSYQFSSTNFDFIVAPGISDEQNLWTRMYDKLGEEKTEASSY